MRKNFAWHALIPWHVTLLWHAGAVWHACIQVCPKGAERGKAQGKRAFYRYTIYLTALVYKDQGHDNRHHQHRQARKRHRMHEHLAVPWATSDHVAQAVVVDDAAVGLAATLNVGGCFLALLEPGAAIVRVAVPVVHGVAQTLADGDEAVARSLAFLNHELGELVGRLLVDVMREDDVAGPF